MCSKNLQDVLYSKSQTDDSFWKRNSPPSNFVLPPLEASHYLLQITGWTSDPVRCHIVDMMYIDRHADPSNAVNANATW